MNETIAIYPGTFDPITLGHIDIIQRASKLFDQVIITLAVNPVKEPMFNSDERKEMIDDAINGMANVSVEQYDGLIVELARKRGATVIVRGLRAISDFEFEFQMALMNRHLAKEITTVFLMPNEKYTYLNSTIIRNVASFGGDINKFVTKFVAEKLKIKAQK
ncbi:MAG TPA: pantetheine-phosphate adenylyltransferase [Calditrichaeota bacterium]|nr:pantetheine-phosphate adenylyltransferase [Calditrichota bacterium]